RQTPRSYRAAALSRRPGYPEWPHENPAPTRHRVEGILPRDRRAAAKVAAARAGENDLALRKTMAEQLIAAGVRLPARSSRPGAGVGPAGHMAVLCNAAPGCRSVWYRPRHESACAQSGCLPLTM